MPAAARKRVISASSDEAEEEETDEQQQQQQVIQRLLNDPDVARVIDVETSKHLDGVDAAEFDDDPFDDDDDGDVNDKEEEVVEELSQEAVGKILKDLSAHIMEGNEDLKKEGINLRGFFPEIHHDRKDPLVKSSTVIELANDQKVLILFYVNGVFRLGELAVDAAGNEGLRSVNIMWSVGRLSKLRVELENTARWYDRDANHRHSEINTVLTLGRGSGYRTRFYSGYQFGDFGMTAETDTEGEPQGPPSHCMDWHYLATEYNPSQSTAHHKALKGGKPKDNGRMQVCFFTVDRP